MGVLGVLMENICTSCNNYYQASSSAYFKARLDDAECIVAAVNI